MKNLLRLHEAIALALLKNQNRCLSFTLIAGFIEKRNLFPKRKGGITLEKQIELRTKPSSNYVHLFEVVDGNKVKLKNI